MHSIMSDEQYAMTRYLDVVGSNPIPANYTAKFRYIQSLIVYYNKILVVGKLQNKEGLKFHTLTIHILLSLSIYITIPTNIISICRLSICFYTMKPFYTYLTDLVLYTKTKLQSLFLNLKYLLFQTNLLLKQNIKA